MYYTLQQARKVILISHKNPDGDTLGSVTALMHLLETINIPHIGFCVTPIEDKFLYLPYVDKITNDPKIWQDTNIDVVITCDGGDLDYLGIRTHIEGMKQTHTLLNIDHHQTNKKFGDINLVVPTAASTTEIIYGIFEANTLLIEQHVATSLLTGLITDTDNFTNGATTASSLAIASKLIHLGGNIALIQDRFIHDKTLDVLKVWGTVLGRLVKDEELDLVYTYLTLNDLKQCDVAEAETDGLANFLNNLGEGKAEMILKQIDTHTFKGSFRTTNDNVNVAKWALSMGGGGHKKASGFSVEAKTPEDAIKQILNNIREIEQI